MVPPPFIVFVIPGVALFFFVQMLLCEAYHFHVTVTRHKKYARDSGNGRAIKDKERGKDKEGAQDGPEGQEQEVDEVSYGYPEDGQECSYVPSAVTQPSSAPSLDEGSCDRSKARRKSVFAESYDPATDDTEPVVHEKSEDEKQWLIDNLKKITLFQHLEPEQIQTVVDAMYKQEVSPKEVVMKQGDKGNIFYVIKKGVFTVHVKDSSGNVKLMHTYENEGSFGELALLYNQPRAATITCKSGGELWAVDGQTFRRIVHKITYEKRIMYENLINNVPMLESLQPFECSNLVDALVPKTYRDKEQIIKQGEKADGMYFVINGTVKLKVKTDAGKEAHLKTLKGGDYFGELGLLANKPRAASAYADGAVTVAFLDREAFERLLGPCMDIMQRNITGYERELEEIIHDK